MNRFQITLICSCLALPLAQAQVSVGFSGGPVQSGFHALYQGSRGGHQTAVETQFDTERSFQFNMPVAIRFHRYFSLQPELSYQRFAANIRSRYVYGDQMIRLRDEEQRIRLNYFYGSLLGKISLGGPAFAIHFTGGPAIGYTPGGNSETTEHIYYPDGSREQGWYADNFSIGESDFRSWDYGWTYGGGVTIGLPHYQVTLEARRYEAVSTVGTTAGYRLRNESWSLLAGVLFPIR